MSLPLITEELSKWSLVSNFGITLLSKTLAFSSNDLYSDYNSTTFRKDYTANQLYKGDKNYIAKHLDLVNGLVNSTDQFALLLLINLQAQLDIATQLTYTLPNGDKLVWDLDLGHSHIVNDRAINYGYTFDLKMAVTNLEPIVEIYVLPVATNIRFSIYKVPGFATVPHIETPPNPSLGMGEGVTCLICEEIDNLQDHATVISAGWQFIETQSSPSHTVSVYYNSNISNANGAQFQFNTQSPSTSRFIAYISGSDYPSTLSWSTGDQGFDPSKTDDTKRVGMDNINVFYTTTELIIFSYAYNYTVQGTGANFGNIVLDTTDKGPGIIRETQVYGTSLDKKPTALLVLSPKLQNTIPVKGCVTQNSSQNSVEIEAITVVIGVIL